GFVLRTTDRADAVRFANSLVYFGIGSSWGGFESLIVLPQPIRKVSDIAAEFGPGCLVRLHIGLEDVEDLIGDLEQAFAAMRRGT
ncbi:PLP-dependent transferase, partial [Sneathiella sp.]|uniref:PLP-dependent transferase n=1 Tax=Sneathiella sp. TaxID=1964365 RepID=UPI0035628791